MKQLFLPALVVLLFAACKKVGGSENPPPRPLSPDEQQDMAVVDGKITTFLTTYNITDASLAVTKNGKLVYRKGLGVADQASGEKVTPDHRFRLASVSKIYAGTAVMKLVQEGKLSLDAKVFGDGAVAELTKGSSVFPCYAPGIGIWSAENLWYTYGSLPGTRTGFMRYNNGPNAVLLLNSRVNPASETAFVQGMQNLLLDMVKNSTHALQDIDQFSVRKKGKPSACKEFLQAKKQKRTGMIG